MEEKKYHIEESKIAGDKVCEPSPAYRSAASSASSASWDEAYDTDSYPMGRSLEQVMAHKPYPPQSPIHRYDISFPPYFFRFIVI